MSRAWRWRWRRFVVWRANEICVMLSAHRMIVCAFVLRVLFLRVLFMCVSGVCGVCWLLCFISMLFDGVSSPIPFCLQSYNGGEGVWQLLAISIVKCGDFSCLTRCFSMRYKEWKYFSFFHFILQHHAAWSLNRGGKVMIRKKFVTCDTSQQKRKGYALPFPTRAIYLLDV